MRLFNFYLAIFILLITTVNSSAQQDVTTFLGIPIDGFKPEIITKLKYKGFKNSQYLQDVLTGEFNGANVNLHIVTNNNKVYRIMVADENGMDESDIKIRFNNLCQQFQNNSRYIFAIPNSECKITDFEKISYEMAIKNKRYEAVFYQVSDSNFEELKSYLISKYSQEKLSNQSEEFKKQLLSDATSYFAQKQLNKIVWFMITEVSGKYYITMFYDNEYNRAKGEDL
jgi:hypothetical protein